MTEFPPPAPHVLRNMAEEHVFYELCRVVEFLRFGNVVPLKDGIDKEVRRRLLDWAASAILESALIHVRNISDFLTRERPTHRANRTDLVADHYFDEGWTGRPTFIFGTCKAEHDAVLTEINRRVAHISTQRSSVETDGAFAWNNYVREQVPGALPAFRAFLNDLGQQHRARLHWFARCDALLADFRTPSL